MKAPVGANAARSGNKRSPGLKHGPTHAPLYGKSPSSPDRKRAYFPGFKLGSKRRTNLLQEPCRGKSGLGIDMSAGDVGCLSQS